MRCLVGTKNCGTKASWTAPLWIALSVAVVTAPSSAAPFAVFDPRAMALGGAGVAEATTAAAGYYNPGLFALFRDDEDKLSHSRWAAPIVSAKVSESFDKLAEFQDQNYDGVLRATISNFNTVLNNPSLEAAAASQVASVAKLIQSDLTEIANDPQIFDVTLSMSIGLSSDRSGGGFFATARTYGSGEVRLTEADRQLLSDYVDGMTFIATSGQEGRNVPALFNPGGQLLDRTNDLTSSAAAQALFLFEAGVPFGSRWRYQGRSWYVGLTPKIQTLATFDFDENVHSQSVSVRKDSKARTGINADIGVATYWNDRVRLGTAVKDILTRKLATDLGNTISVGPSWRIGATYLGDRITVTGDLDVVADDPVGVEPRSNYLMGGIEYSLPANLHLRSGARLDLRSGPERFTWTVGAGAAFRAFFTDVAYALSSQSRAASMQFGMRF